MATTPNIIDVYPAPNSVGIVIGDQVKVTFDQEMDEASINSGTFVVAAPEKGIVFFGNATPFDVPGLDDEEVLESPYYGGHVKGTISFSRIDASGAPVDDSAEDPTGAGNLWRTVAIFTPDQPFIPNKEYTVILAGDEDLDDGFDSGVTTRTVFDPVAVAVSGTGTPYFSGGYTGSNSRTYHVEITAGGQVGNATYQWWEENDPIPMGHLLLEIIGKLSVCRQLFFLVIIDGSLQLVVVRFKFLQAPRLQQELLKLGPQKPLSRWRWSRLLQEIKRLIWIQKVFQKLLLFLTRFWRRVQLQTKILLFGQNLQMGIRTIQTSNIQEKSPRS
jgi:hypothetical protein